MHLLIFVLSVLIFFSTAQDPCIPGHYVSSYSPSLIFQQPASASTTFTSNVVSSSNIVYSAGYFSGTFSFLGTSLVSAGSFDGFVVAWNPNTNTVLWSRQISSNLADYVYAMVLYEDISNPQRSYLYVTGTYRDGSSFRVGSTSHNAYPDSTTTKGFLAKLSLSNGNVDYLKGFGTTNYIIPKDMYLLQQNLYVAGNFEGNFYITGNTAEIQPTQYTGMFLLEVASAGNTTTVTGFYQNRYEVSVSSVLAKRSQNSVSVYLTGQTTNPNLRVDTKSVGNGTYAFVYRATLTVQNNVRTIKEEDFFLIKDASIHSSIAQGQIYAVGNIASTSITTTYTNTEIMPGGMQGPKDLVQNQVFRLSDATSHMFVLAFTDNWSMSLYSTSFSGTLSSMAVDTHGGVMIYGRVTSGSTTFSPLPQVFNTSCPSFLLRFTVSSGIEVHSVLPVCSNATAAVAPDKSGAVYLVGNSNQLSLQNISFTFANSRNFAIKALLTCQACPTGTFSQSVADRRSACSLCDPGYSNNRTGATDCTACSPGFYSPTSGLVNCLACPVGLYNNATNMTSCIPCNEGFYNPFNQSTECIPCALGRYSANKGSTLCAACPAGTFNNIIGRDRCGICPSSTYNDEIGAVMCKSCPSSASCLFGSISPAYIYIPSSNSSILDPYVKSALDSQANESFSYTLRLGVVFGVIVACIICFLLLFGLIYIVFISTLVSEGIRKKAANVFRKLDMFTLNHPVDDGEPPINRSTIVGSVFSIICIFGVIGVIVLSILDTASGNTYDTQMLIPEHVLSKELQNLSMERDYRLRLAIHNYIGESCNASFIQDGFIPTNRIRSQCTSFNFNRSCECIMTCQKCKLSGSTQRIQYVFSSRYAMASAIEYKLSLPHFYNLGEFVVEEQIVADNPEFEILRGLSATTISLSLIKTYFTRLAGDYFFFNMFTRQFNSDALTTIGYVASRFPTKLGSVVTNNTFDPNLSSQQSVAIKFDLALSSNVFRIQQMAKQTILDFLSKILALISAVSGVSAMVMQVVEKNIRRCRARNKVKNMEANQIELKDQMSALLARVEQLEQQHAEKSTPKAY